MAGKIKPRDASELSVLVCTFITVCHFWGNIANFQIKESAANQNSSDLK